MEPLFGWPIQILSPANVVRRRSIFLSKVDIQNPVLCEGPLSSPAFHPQLLLSGVRGVAADRSILLILPENRSRLVRFIDGSAWAD